MARQMWEEGLRIGVKNQKSPFCYSIECITDNNTSRCNCGHLICEIPGIILDRYLRVNHKQMVLKFCF